jgi:hypothetical protein
MGVNLRITARMCRNFIQPEGLADGSRWSRGKGARPPGRETEVGCTPAGVPEPLRRCRVALVSGTPPGCSLATRQFPVVVPPFPSNDHRLPSANPSGWRQGESVFFVFVQVLRLTPMRFSGVLARPEGMEPFQRFHRCAISVRTVRPAVEVPRQSRVGELVGRSTSVCTWSAFT